MAPGELRPTSQEPVRPDSVNEIGKGSDYDWLLYATGIILGKYTPRGFDEATSMMHESADEVRPVHHLWRMVEAGVEGRLPELYAADPASMYTADSIVGAMVDDHEDLMEVMMAQLRTLPSVGEPMDTSAAEPFRLGSVLGLPSSDR